MNQMNVYHVECSTVRRTYNVEVTTCTTQSCRSPCMHRTLYVESKTLVYILDFAGRMRQTRRRRSVYRTKVVRKSHRIIQSSSHSSFTLLMRGIPTCGVRVRTLHSLRTCRVASQQKRNNYWKMGYLL
jgi:hypothetical protein